MSDEIKDSAADKKVTVAEVKKSVDDLWGAFKRLQKVCEIHFGVDVNKDGKKGSVRVASLIVILFASLAFATSDVVVWYSSDTTKGTAKITSDDAGAATLTVDKVVAASGVTGPVTGGTATGVTNVNQVATGGTYAGGTVTRGTNVTPVITGGTATGLTNANSVFSGTISGLSLVTNIGPTVTGGTFTGSTNANQVATAGTFAGGTATGMTNANQVATAGTFAGGTATSVTNITPVITGGTTANGTNTGTTVAAEISLDGKYATVGGDATTGLMIQKGTFTNGQATVTFGAAFISASTPVVICGWTQDGSAMLGSNCAIFATSIVSNQFVPKTEMSVTGTALTNANYIAIGTRP